MPHLLSQLRIAGSTINQLRQLVQHKLRREQFRQIGKLLRTAGLFQRRTAHAADAVRKPLSIRNQRSFRPNIVPPDRDIDVVEAVVIEEPLFGKQPELGKKRLWSRPGRSGGRGRGPERAAAKNKSVRTRVDPTEKGLYGLMQLAQSGIAPHDNTSPDMRAGPAQDDAKPISANLLI